MSTLEIIWGRFFDSFNPFAESNFGSFFFMWILSILAALAITITIERYVFIFNKSNLNAPKFMTLIRKYVRGKELKRAIALCHSMKDKALAHVVLSGLIKATKMQTPTFRGIQNAVDEGTLEVIPRLQSRTGFLNMIANVSTLMGLMGTIWGLIISFSNVETASTLAGAKTSALAQGIAIAMNTTFFGLAIAIFSVFAYTILHNKTNQIIDEIDEHTVKLINLMTEEE